MNICIFTGNIGRDAEVRHTSTGKTVASWSIGVSKGWGENKSTLWVRCNLWGDRAEKLAPYLLKGGKVTVTGEIDLSEYESNGEKRHSLDLFVRDLELPPRASPAADFNPDSDIPFANPYKYREYVV